MARGRKGLGVEPLAESIRFSFTLRGEQVRETVLRAPTSANLKWAKRQAADIRAAIDAGTFERDYREFFPDSKRAARTTGARTLADFCKLFLCSITDKSANTKAQYRNALAWWQRQLGADTAVADIRHSALKALWGATPWASWKLANNYLIPLRGVFALAVGDHLVPKSPVDGLVNKRKPPGAKEPPDPFTAKEEASILARLARREPQAFNYFDFAFATGMRPEEMIELKWADIDFPTGIARVTRVRSLGEVRAPKNWEYRDVELNQRALACLARQKPFTAMRDHGCVFENAATRSPWNSTASQRDHHWTPALRAEGIRYRTPYNARHTRATRLLMAGCKPAWCAAQLGHSTEMFFRVYSKWIDGEDRGSELAKDEAAILPVIFHADTAGEEMSKEIKQLGGRRDWTRTKLRRVKPG